MSCMPLSTRCAWSRVAHSASRLAERQFERPRAGRVTRCERCARPEPDSPDDDSPGRSFGAGRAWARLEAHSNSQLFPRCLSRSRHHSSLCIGTPTYDLLVCWISTFRFQARGSAAEHVSVPCTVSLSHPLLPPPPSLRAKHTRKADRIASTPHSLGAAPQRTDHADVTDVAVVAESEHPCLPLVTFPCLAAIIFFTSLINCVLAVFQRL